MRNQTHLALATTLAAVVTLGCWGVSDPSPDDAVDDTWGTPYDAMRVWQVPLVVDVTYDTLRNPLGGRYVQATVQGTNLGETRISGATSGCWSEFRAYRGPERTGEPVWTEPANPDCNLYQFVVDLSPGESITWKPRPLWLNVDDLVTEHGAGTYYFLMRIIFATPEVRTGPLLAGEVYLGP
jgi:hypothetical protein